MARPLSLWIAVCALLVTGVREGHAASPDVKQMRVNGVTLPYVEQGQGAPVVFVHGGASDRRAWDPHREAVAHRYRFIALDQRYYGTSPWPDDGSKFSLATHLDDLAAFVRGLKAGPVHLVGWSYGGAVSLALAAQQPALVKSAFLYEPSLTTFVTDPADAKVMAEDRKAMFAPAVAATTAGNTAAAVRALIDGVNAQPGTFDALPPARRSALLDNARVLPRVFAAPPPPAITCAHLGQIRAPVAIARGDLTRAFYRITADTASRCIPGSRLIIVAQGRHLWPGQDPSAFTHALLGFLDGAGAIAGGAGSSGAQPTASPK